VDLNDKVRVVKTGQPTQPGSAHDGLVT